MSQTADSRSVFERCAANPVLSPEMVPYPCTYAYNAGVEKVGDRYVMVFRCDYYDSLPARKAPEMTLGTAFSRDGINWEVSPDRCRVTYRGTALEDIYDPRLTLIDGIGYLCFVQQTFHGLRAGIAVTEDFHSFEVLSLTTPDNRNLVLFPERVDGMYVRLERPFPMYGRRAFPAPGSTQPADTERFDIWLSRSPDLRFWGESELVLGVEDVPFSNAKIGPGPPPVRTREGWLTLFHAVDIDARRPVDLDSGQWEKRYTVGLMLLDLKDPAKVIGLCREPVLVPEAAYETERGNRRNVIFPGGMIAEDSGEVKIYYGAADTTECLATSHIDSLLAMAAPYGQ